MFNTANHSGFFRKGFDKKPSVERTRILCDPVQGKSTEKEVKVARGEIETSYFLRTGDSPYTLMTLGMGSTRV